MSDIDTMERILIREERKESEKAQDELVAQKRKRRQFLNDLGLPHLNDYGVKGKYVPPISVTSPATLSRKRKAEIKEEVYAAKVDMFIMHYLARVAVAIFIFSIPSILGIL